MNKKGWTLAIIGILLISVSTNLLSGTIGLRRGYAEGVRQVPVQTVTEPLNCTPDRCYSIPELIPLETQIANVNYQIPSNGTNCLNRAMALKNRLEANGINATVTIGATLDMKIAHAWITLDKFEIWGSKEEYPIPYGATYYAVTELETNGGQ